MNTIKIGLLGFGVVGSGVLKVLQRNYQKVCTRAGHELVIKAIASRSLKRLGENDAHNIRLGNDLTEVVDDPDIDIIVELIGGVDTAYQMVKRAIQNGKHIVTANKALLALHGNELFSMAEEKGIQLKIEAAVAGGIPIIKVLKECLVANQIHSMIGIVNGTCNYILSKIHEEHLSFKEALCKAQELGFAEADPSFDIHGIDAAHKLCLMATLAFGIPLDFSKVYIEGVDGIEQQDFIYAKALGYRIKLLAIAKHQVEGVELRVHPCLIQEQHLLANVENEKNAILVNCDALGDTLYYGAGAGAEPTASSVIADIVDIAQSINIYNSPNLGYQSRFKAKSHVLPIQEVASANYLRIHFQDRMGILAEITHTLSNHQISIIEIMQKHRSHHSKKEIVDIIIVTDKTLEKNVLNAICDIEQLPTVLGKVVRIRLEYID